MAVKTHLNRISFEIELKFLFAGLWEKSRDNRNILEELNLNEPSIDTELNRKSTQMFLLFALESTA